MRSIHSSRAFACSVAALLVSVLTATAARAQNGAAASYTVFLRGFPIGSEQVTVDRSGQEWVINSSGRVGDPVGLVLRTFNARYDADWKPLELFLDTTVVGQSTTIHTNVSGTQAKSAVTPLGQNAVERTDTIDPRAIFLPNPIVAAYAALAARLRDAPTGSTLAIYQPALGSFSADVGSTSEERIQTLDRTIVARRTHLVFRLANAPPLDLEVWGDEQGRLLRVSIPPQALEFAREDVASVSARLVTMQRPNDEAINVPANGFSLAGTISKPRDRSGALPAVVLLSGSGETDRDEIVAGIPLFGQIANALADAGFLVLRYDKRGIGQSGGRPESATLTDYAEDARYAVSALWDRKDVDRKRIALVGYGEGGWIAMLAAAKNNRIAAIALLETVASTGSDQNLYQIAHQFERTNGSEADKQRALDLQRRVQQAVVTGKGWENIEVAPPVRRQADTPYFQSFLAFDPAKVMKDIKQPVLVIQGDLDKEVPLAAADQLAALAKARKQGAAEVTRIPGLNHLLVPAQSGEIDEYARLTSRTIAPAVLKTLTDWMSKTLAAPR